MHHFEIEIVLLKELISENVYNFLILTTTKQTLLFFYPYTNLNNIGKYLLPNSFIVVILTQMKNLFNIKILCRDSRVLRELRKYRKKTIKLSNSNPPYNLNR